MIAQAIQKRTALLGIIGLGYVGLPLVRAFSAGGYKVLGFDSDSNKIDMLARGEAYIRHIPAATIQAMQKQGFTATSDLSRLKEPDVIIICVPTPLTETREPDLQYIVSSTEAIAKALRPGQLIVLESTTYPGTTRDVMLPILEASGLKLGTDFFLAYSPEREDPGNDEFQTASIPKVVGGIEPTSAELAVSLYRQIVKQVVPVSSCEIAEACKILENTYRAVNIALVNELKILFQRMGINVWEVIDAAKTKPFGFQAFYPGPGLGGHCIPIDPFYLTWIARKYGLSTRFIELAGEVNTSMPSYVVARVIDALNERSKAVKGSKILVLGVAYKKDVDDVRESPALEIIDLLMQKGAAVTFHDPYVLSIPRTRHYPALADVPREELTPEVLKTKDCVLIVTNHSAYEWNHIVQHASLIIDTRNAIRRGGTGSCAIVES
ncbi:MAG TPA: nucleotide sugar dehydrogenase [Pirellulales bacterium]|jgi:UDP-N-acetyl-D-glucosamine dehydrogenase